MSNEWQITPMPSEAEANPQVHWLNDIAQEARAITVLLRLSAAAAENVLQIYSDRYRTDGQRTADEPSLHEILDAAVMDQDTLDRLERFVGRKGDDPTEVVLVVRPQGGEALRTLLGDPSAGVELLDVGVGLPLDIVGRGGTLPSPAPRGEPLDEDAVIVAIIDDGIGFANHRFRLSETQTRFEHFWAMRSPSSEGGGGQATGTTLDKQAIDTLLAACNGEDERVYRAAGLIDFTKPSDTTPFGRSAPPSLAFGYAHGTHVLDIAAGYDWRDPDDAKEVRKRRLIGVQLPAAVVAETSGAGTSVDVKRALDWILAKTRELSPRSPDGKANILPLIVNFSFGVSAGPMDGKGLVDKRIEEFLEDYSNETGDRARCHVVLPSGNGFHSRSVGRVAARELEPERAMAWRVLPDDRTASFVDIWTQETEAGSPQPQQIAVSLEPPRGGPSTRIKTEPGHILEWVVDGVVLARLYHRVVAREGGKIRENVLIAIRPTEREGHDEPLCPSGDWAIRMEALDLPADSEIELRVQRDDPRTGQSPKGRQSYFSDPAYLRFDPVTGRLPEDGNGDGEWVSRRGTFNAYGNRKNDPNIQPPPVIVVGGYTHSDGKPARYTGAGPTVTREGPGLSAVTEESPSHVGVIASGTYTGSVYAQNGTSVAVPAVVRALADAIVDPINRPYPPPEPTEGPHGTYPIPDESRLGARRLPKGETPKSRERIFTGCSGRPGHPKNESARPSGGG